MGKPHRKPARQRQLRQPPTEPIFGAGSPDRAFVPLVDLFAGNLNSARRVAYVRAGFIEELLRDPRVVRLFGAWLERLQASPDSFDSDDALALVQRELGIRWPWWPWCVVAILEVFHRMVQTQSTRVELEYGPSVLAPLSAVVMFWPEFGEDTSHARVRLTEEYRAAMAELDGADKEPSGAHAPKNAGQHLRLAGRWLYQTTSAGREINKIAKQHHADAKHPGEFNAHGCRTDIRKAIRTAETLLSLAWWRPGRGEDTGAGP